MGRAETVSPAFSFGQWRVLIILCVLVAKTGHSWARLHKGTGYCRSFDEVKGVTKTEICAETTDHGVGNVDEPYNYMACFTSWVNSTEYGVKITRQGCWLNDDNCNSLTECVSKHSKRPHFCCCNTDNCNINFRAEPAMEEVVVNPDSPLDINPYLEGEEGDPGIVRSGGNHPVRQTILWLSIVIGAAVLLVVTSCLVYRRLPGRRHHTQLPTSDPYTNGNGFNYYPGTMVGPTTTAASQQAPLNIQLLELKAHGRYGSVWKAQLPDQYVAVKIFPLQDKQSWLAELEVYALSQMKHDNILKFIVSEERNDGETTKLWLVTEYHDRGSLCDFLKGNTISWAELCRIGETMACGLAYLHDEIPDTPSLKGKPAVAHRDLKSKNVLLKHDLSACIADFGLALKFEPGKGSNETHPQVGTRRYMAPEVLEGAICFNRDSFLRIDMYACGLIVWELMTRCTAVDGPVSDYRLPFEAEVGQQPSLEDMQTLVVTRKMRPALNTLWNKHPGLYGMIPTVEECWDQDAEARLSAGCVQERIRQLSRTVNSQPQTTMPAAAPASPPPQQQPPSQPQQHQHGNGHVTMTMTASPFMNGNNNSSLTSTPPCMALSNSPAAVIMTSNSGAPSPPPPPAPLYVMPSHFVGQANAPPAVVDVSREARPEVVPPYHQHQHPYPGTTC